MIQFQDFELDNGLRLLVHEDKTTPLAIVSLTYNVGSRDEDQTKTGLAHLFEHLMFGGSKNIPNYDEPLQKVGGDNNAFTSPDITNYHISLPAVNLETAFWLESDRMLELAFDEKSIEVQKKVVMRPGYRAPPSYSRRGGLTDAHRRKGRHDSPGTFIAL